MDRQEEVNKPFSPQDSFEGLREEFCRKEELKGFESYEFCEDQSSLIEPAPQLFNIDQDVFINHAFLMIIQLIPL